MLILVETPIVGAGAVFRHFRGTSDLFLPRDAL